MLPLGVVGIDSVGYKMLRIRSFKADLYRVLEWVLFLFKCLTQNKSKCP